MMIGVRAECVLIQSRSRFAICKMVDLKMRTVNACAVIERAKALHGLNQDQELAQMLGVSKNALASWKRRGSVPTKHLIGMVLESDKTVD